MQNAAVSGIPGKCYRLFVTDENTKLKFLVDTGANISVIPRKKGTTAKPTPFSLYAANNTVIPTYGEKTLELNIKLRRPYKWKFIVADVNRPIIGADFLNHHQLIVDLRNRRLIDHVTNLSVRAQLGISSEPTIRSIDVDQHYHKLLADFPDITRLTAMKETPKHRVEHYIETTGPPIYCKSRPLPPHRYLPVKKEFENMMQQGICRPSKSPWSSPLHVVPKKNGDIRVCGDYRRLNAITKPDRYPVPRLKDFTYLLHDKKIFSTIDLNRAYQQLPVFEPHVEKTAIITPFGLFEFPRMCPGLKNAGQTFQRFIHQVLNGLDYAFPFIDDVIVISDSVQQHQEDLRAVLQRLNDYGITINPSKCVFGKDTVKFLGYEVSQEGIKPPLEKINAIVAYPKPNTIEELRRFLGMVNFYRENIPDAALLQAPLNAYLHNTKKKDKTLITWNEQSSQAFEACKVSIQNAALLAHPSQCLPVALMCDASNSAAGGVLQQKVNNKWMPLGYFSKKFSDAQQRYSTFDRELLSIYMAVKHFRKLFEGRELTIYTDHKPLTYAIHKPPSDSETQRRARQLLYISEFTTDLQHISGANNVVADALSRIEAVDIPSTIDYNQLATAQEEDSTIPILQQRPNLSVKKIAIPNKNIQIYCETSTKKARPYLPEEFRRQAFDAIHNISHPGVRTSRKMVTSKYFWPSMNSDVGSWAKTCESCQRSKVQRHTHSEIEQFPACDRFEHVHIDIVGPLPTSAEGHRYLLTMIDRNTRWPEAIPMQDITAETIGKTLYDSWICRFGCPATITTDQGRQFESQLFRSLATQMGIKRNRTTAYHPQANGIVERWHRTLKTALKTRLNGRTAWVNELPTILLGLRAAPRSDTGVSAAELTIGHNIRLPGDFFTPAEQHQPGDNNFVTELRRNINKLQPAEIKRSHANGHTLFVHRDLATCDSVFVRSDAVRKPLQPPYEGPYPVISRTDKVFKIQLPQRQANISIDRLKPAYTINFNDERTRECSTATQETSARTTTSIHSPRNTTPIVTTGTTPQIKITRAGRTSKPPVRFA